jgi:integrase
MRAGELCGLRMSDFDLWQRLVRVNRSVWRGKSQPTKANIGIDVLKAIKREETKLEKQLGKLNHQLNGVRAAVIVWVHATTTDI